MAKKPPPLTLARLLEQIPSAELNAWLVTAAKAMPEFGKRLELFAARHCPEEVALVRYRATLTRLVKLRSRNPRKRATEAAQHFDELIGGLEAEFAAGRMAIVMTVCLEALAALNDFLWMNRGVKEKLEPRIAQLTDLHLRAATEFRPNREELATALVEEGQKAVLSAVFREAAYDYQDVLGETGLAHYRKAMEPYWRAVQTKEPMLWNRREQTIRQMLAWARAQEDPATRAAEGAEILAAVAVSAGEFLQAARSFLRAGKQSAALAAARQGFDRAIQAPLADASLLDLAILCMERAAPAEAAEIAWTAFCAQTDRDSYTLLREAAAACGTEAGYQDRAQRYAEEKGLSWNAIAVAAR